MKKILAIIALLLPIGAIAQNAALPIQLCVQNGTQAVTSGLKSTNYQEGVVPYCTVSVYLTGTTNLATLSTSTGGSLGNPFQANANGSFLAYVAVNQGYDVTLSGGFFPNNYISPVTITGLYPGQNFPGGCGPGIPFSISCGGTGATTASGALANLGGNQAAIFPSQCRSGNPPSWCPTEPATMDAEVNAACTALPVGGGTIDLGGYVGFGVQYWAASASNCKLFLGPLTVKYDNAAPVVVTETDGLISLPLPNSASIDGGASGQCVNEWYRPQGWTMTSTANITAIFGPAYMNATQEDLAIHGICASGAIKTIYSVASWTGSGSTYTFTDYAASGVPAAGDTLLLFGATMPSALTGTNGGIWTVASSSGLTWTVTNGGASGGGAVTLGQGAVLQVQPASYTTSGQSVVIQTTQNHFTSGQSGAFLIQSGPTYLNGYTIPIASATSFSVTINFTGVTTATYVSGGSPVGTGTVKLTGFNNCLAGKNGPSATMAITSGTPGAITMTTYGQGCTAAPTTATCTNVTENPGTATCTGTVTITSTEATGSGSMTGTIDPIPTVSKGLLLLSGLGGVNTTISNVFLSECPNACIWVENSGGSMTIEDAEMDASHGVPSMFGSALVLYASTGAISGGDIQVHGGNAEHASGTNQSEIKIFNDGQSWLTGIHVSDYYLERSAVGVPSQYSILIDGCWDCSFMKLRAGGLSNPPGTDFIHIAQTVAGSDRQISVGDGVSNGQTANYYYTNTVNDVPENRIITGNIAPTVDKFVAFKGYDEDAAAPNAAFVGLGADAMGGAGVFSGAGTTYTGWSTYQVGLTGLVTWGLNADVPGADPLTGVAGTSSQDIIVAANTSAINSLAGIQSTSTPASLVAGTAYQFRIATKTISGNLGYLVIFIGKVGISNCGDAQYAPNFKIPVSGSAWTYTSVTCTAIRTESDTILAAAIQYPPTSAGVPPHQAGEIEIANIQMPTYMGLIAGDLNVAQTNNTSGPFIATTGCILYQSAAEASACLAGNTAATDQVLTSTGTGSAAQAPTLKNAPALAVTNMTGSGTFTASAATLAAASTNIAGGVAGSTPVQTGVATTGFVAPNATGSTDAVLTSTSVTSAYSATAYKNAPALSLANMTGTIPAAALAGSRQMIFTCQGTVGTGNGTAYYLAPGNASTTGGCNQGVGPSPIMAESGTISTCWAKASVGGAASGSGSITLTHFTYTGTPGALTQGAATKAVCTLGIGTGWTQCNGTGLALTFAAGDGIAAFVSTGQATDTTANVSVTCLY